MDTRRFRDGVDLSILGFGGMVLVGMEQDACDRIVAGAVTAGVNYFDVAPAYGDGEAEIKMGIALAPFRDQVFLACKTFERRAAGAARDLERSLERLRTDRFDLYQFHAVVKQSEVDRIFAAGGAVEAVVRAREQGKIRFVGFSAHSAEAALAMMERMDFDSILLPVNYVLFAKSPAWVEVLGRSVQLGVARLALKSMALRPWRRDEERIYPNCWYRPIDDPVLARQGLRFALSENITSLIPPGDPRLFRMALDMARELTPMTGSERAALLESARSLAPILK
ncbi:MAG: aldo/keto reductase [Acidobacteria bacterium]|nr:aldo/keto reductase [Acidobacteriota bacterium]